MIPVDTSVEWPKTEIWGWAEGLLCCAFTRIFNYLSHLNPYSNIVSNWKGLIPAV